MFKSHRAARGRVMHSNADREYLFRLADYAVLSLEAPQPFEVSVVAALVRRPPRHQRERRLVGQGCQMAKFDPFLSLDCARVEDGGTIHGKKGIKFCSAALRSHSPSSLKGKVHTI